jgi:hypothetical protein
MKYIISIILIFTSLIALFFNALGIYIDTYNLDFKDFETIWKIRPYNNIIFEIGIILLAIYLLFLNNSSNTKISDENITNENDIPSFGINVICFFIPIVGLILYLVTKDQTPKKAISAGKSALWGVGISVILTILSIFISMSIIASIK